MTALARTLEAAFARALAAIDLEARTRDAMATRVPRDARVRVLAIGKAAPAMARGALDALGARVVDALVVVPDGVDVAGVDATVVRAGHPLPDARSVRAGARALDVARASGRDRCVLVALISGGASALLCAPYETTLARKTATVRALLHSRATIAELNCVRRHASRVKGGALLAASRPARVVSLVASDVIGGAVHDIGSGPTLADPTSLDDARAVLARHSVPALPLRGSAVRPGSRDARRASVHVVASPRDLAVSMRRELELAGFRARIAASRVGDVASFAKSYVRLARTLEPGEAIVRAAEPSVLVDVARPGRGGRSSHLAALVAADLPRDVVFMAAASDGVDGASGAGGAIVDHARWSRLAETEIADALARFDTAALHDRAHTALAGSPTGHNLADLHVLARAPRAARVTARSPSRAPR
jgi:hydroxypyruvate reductase